MSYDLICLTRLNQQIQSISPSKSSSESSESTFEKVLKSVSSEMIRNEENSEKSKYLSPEQMIMISCALKNQMNAHLYKTFFGRYYSSNALSICLNFDCFQNLDGLTSKNGQLTPQKKSDAGTALDPIIERAAQKYQVDPELIRSVIKAESNFDQSATSSRGAMGLMQLMPETAKEMGIKNAYNPEENVMAGTRYLKMLLDRYDNDLGMALAAYNWGMGNLESNFNKIPRETINYVQKVTESYMMSQKS